MRELLCIGAGGFLGAIARYLVGQLFAARVGVTFPYGTLAINVSGSFLLGVLGGVVDMQLLSPLVRLTAGVGFLGAYTTFSTFTYETLHLFENGNWLAASGYVVGSVAAGLIAAILGLALGRGL